MRSAARLTYTRRRRAFLERRRPASTRRAGRAAARRSLDACTRVYEALREQREARGALDFETPEVKVKLVDEAGSVDATSVEYPRNDAHRLIEECMIAANVEAARFLKKHKVPTLFRVHGRPEDDRLEDAAAVPARCSACMLDIGGRTRRPSACSKAAAASIGERPDAGRARRRGHPLDAAGASTSRGNIGHFGLALDRVRALHLADPPLPGPARASRHPPGARRAATAQDFVAFGTARWRCSGRTARCASGARTRRRAGASPGSSATTCRTAIGEEFDAVVAGVVEFGVFVQLKACRSTAWCTSRRCRGDYFRFHEGDRTLVGERTGMRFTIGDELRVRLMRVDSDERKIDFELVDEDRRRTATRADARASRPDPAQR